MEEEQEAYSWVGPVLCHQIPIMVVKVATSRVGWPQHVIHYSNPPLLAYSVLTLLNYYRPEPETCRAAAGWAQHSRHHHCTMGCGSCECGPALRALAAGSSWKQGLGGSKTLTGRKPAMLPVAMQTSIDHIKALCAYHVPLPCLGVHCQRPITINE